MNYQKKQSFRPNTKFKQMKKINIIWLFALIALAFSSCHKDINEFIPDKEGQNFKSSLFGSVVDEAGQPVENAIIRYGANTKMTDKNGIYQFKNVDVNSKHNLITISKQGYFEGSRVFTTDRSTTITIRNILLENLLINPLRVLRLLL